MHFQHRRYLGKMDSLLGPVFPLGHILSFPAQATHSPRQLDPLLIKTEENNKTTETWEAANFKDHLKQQSFLLQESKFTVSSFKRSLWNAPGNDFKVFQVTLLIGITSNRTITGLWNIEAKSRLDRSNTTDKSILKSV